MHTSIEKAFRILDIHEDAEGYLTDIKKITCLLLEEGNEYRFVHRSVQEYYAASFVRSRPEATASQFYSDLSSNPIHSSDWSQELLFLSEIDKYRYNEHYLIPNYRCRLAANDDFTLLKGCPTATIPVIKSTIGRILLSFPRNKPSAEISTFYLGGLTDLLPPKTISEFIHALYALDYSELLSKLKSGEIKIRQDLVDAYYYNYWPTTNYMRFNSGHFYEISIQQIIDETILVDDLKVITHRLLPSIYHLWEKAYHYNQRQRAIVIADQISLTYPNVNVL